MELNPIFSEDNDEYLEHYGVPGMKWGVRNAETQRKYAGGKGLRSSLSNINRKRHARAAKAAERDAKDLEKHGYKEEAAAVRKVAQKQAEKAKASNEGFKLSDRQKKAIKVGAVAAGAALAAYAGYKGGKAFKMRQLNVEHLRRGQELAKTLLKDDKVDLNMALKERGLHKNPAYGVPRLPRTIATTRGNTTYVRSRKTEALSDPYIRALIYDMKQQRLNIKNNTVPEKGTWRKASQKAVLDIYEEAKQKRKQ